MKIIHLTYSMQLGGIETMLVNIVNAQCESDKLILMILNDDYDDALVAKVSPKVKVINVGRKLGSKNPFDIVRLNYILFSNRPDILHVHHPSLIRLIARNIMHCKIIFTMHDVPLPEDLPWLPKFKHICAISKSVQSALTKQGYDSHLVENGIDFEGFEKRTIDKEEVFRIIQVGRLVMDKKGQDIAIRAIKILIDKGIKNLSLDIVGDGPDKKSLQNMIVELGLTEHIHLTGSHTQEWLQQHYKDYSFFIQPSRFEGFGLTVAEAIASKVPVLVSDQEGPMEIIKDGIYGFCFKTGDVEDCARQLMNVMATDNVKEITESAYNYAVNKYSVKRTATDYLIYYQRVLRAEA